MTVFGALDYRSGRLITMIHDRASSARFQSFVESLVARWPSESLVLVMDNASYHKSVALRRWLTNQAPQVTLLWLPTYAPQLNLIERVWRFVKQRLACHRLWNDLPGLTTLAESIMDHTRATFSAPTDPHIRLCQNLCQSA